MVSLCQELNQAFVDCPGDRCGNLRAAQELRDQVFWVFLFKQSLCVRHMHIFFSDKNSFPQCSDLNSFLLQNILLQQENAELRNNLVSTQEVAGIVQQAIRDRDEAIAK